MKKKPNTKIIIGVVIIIGALAWLLISSTLSNTQYFMTVEELQADSQARVGQTVRMSGAVIGDTIQYDPTTLQLSFQVAQIPGDHRLIERMGGMQAVLAQAAADPDAARLTVYYHGARPDLLKDQAQAILTGSLTETGEFQATEILLKCPSKYESSMPTPGN